MQDWVMFVADCACLAVCLLSLVTGHSAPASAPSGAVQSGVQPGPGTPAWGACPGKGADLLPCSAVGKVSPAWSGK